MARYLGRTIIKAHNTLKDNDNLPALDKCILWMFAVQRPYLDEYQHFLEKQIT